jgi:hypothetical protein
MRRTIDLVIAILTLLLAACGPVTSSPAATAPSTPLPSPEVHSTLPPPPSSPMPRLSPTPRPSLQITTGPTRTPPPTSTPRTTRTPTLASTATPLPPVAGPFVLVPPESGRPAGEIGSLRVAPDGTLWIVAMKGIGRFRDGTWNRFENTNGVLVGFDASGRAWYVEDNPEAGNPIASWDGTAWTAYGSAEGWTPTSSGFFGENVATDQRGWVWLTTGKDARAWDGTRWTIHTIADIGFVSDEPDYMSLHDVAVDSTGDVWVGECEWWGPGPSGDGARWFDGQSWQGADSPVVGAGSGCVSDVEVDAAGRIWAGVRGLLWRYTPGAGWSKLVPPDPQPEWGRSWGAIYDLTLGPAGEVWMALEPCGGASCSDMRVHYHLVGDEWVRVGDLYWNSDLALAPDGSAWLCADGGVYHVVDHVPGLVAEMGRAGDRCSVEVDPAGRVWVALLGQEVLYVYENP